jgi:DNA-binding beta-propeller fold protein YncE
MSIRRVPALLLSLLASATAWADYTNFEVSHVHPIDLTPSGARLVAVNTPDAVLEIYAVETDGSLRHERSAPVGLEPVTVVARTDTEAWVVNQLSDSISIVDLVLGIVTRTLAVGDEPTDVAFAAGRAFVSVAGLDQVRAYLLANLDAAPVVLPIFSRKPRALAVSADGTRVYAVALFSGNQTTTIGANEIWGTGDGLDLTRLSQLGLNPPGCVGPRPPYPALPPGIARNPALADPQVDPQDPDNRANFPRVGLVVGFDEPSQQWRDDAAQDWSSCLPFRMPDRDLFVIDASTPAVIQQIAHVGTTLFDVAVQPGSGRIWIPNTDARNRVRFEHPLGVQGHAVDNRLTTVAPVSPFAINRIELNAHIDRESDPQTNVAERQASISQPGMLVWNQSGSRGFLVGLGTRKLFRVDGACATSACIFGLNRATPDATEVGEGPSGVALLETRNRVYVLNRFSSTIAVVDATTLVKLDDVPLHDPSPAIDKLGRRFLYDAILSSGHGDQSCASCHISGDRDDLSWDLGAPQGDFAPYTGAGDNVRFIVPVNSNPVTCPDPLVCASHDGFDPQKGPMATQTLRGMLEPLHWRGDRPTMNEFNPAFVGLLGAGQMLPGEQMEQFRQFALRMRFPPNPLRLVDDTLPNAAVPVPGSPFSGNPAAGAAVFDSGSTDAGQPCRSCHAHPFGAAGGTLGGVTPTSPTSVGAAALFNGNADQSPHSDLKVPHLRNMYEKIGPVFGDRVQPPPLARSGTGFVHDGSVPDLGTFLSFSVFTVSAQQVRDLAAFTAHFPTGTRPAVGRLLTVPAGTPPTGTAQDEDVLRWLVGDASAVPPRPPLGDANAPAHHCELVASTRLGGIVRRLRYAGGVWISDLAGDPTRTTTALRQAAQGPITFLCTPIGSGTRLGGDRDEDGVLDRNDCAAADPGAFGAPGEVSGFAISKTPATVLVWNEQATATGPAIVYDVVGGSLATLQASGLVAATGCIAGDLTTPSYTDTAPGPTPGNGRFFLIRARNSCASGTFGPGRGALSGLDCTAP